MSATAKVSERGRDECEGSITPMSTRPGLKVGIAASLTGQFSGQGRQALEGVIAWAGDVNDAGGIFVKSRSGRLPVRLAHYDDESRADVAAAMTEKLIVEDQVDLVLSPYSSVLALAAADVTDRHQRVLWNHGGASDLIYDRGYKWVVGILTPASRYLLGVIDLVKEKAPQAERVAVLHSGRGSFPVAVATGVESYAIQQGFRIVYQGQYRPPIEDFSTFLRDIEKEKPDIILAVGRIQDDMLLARQMVHKGVRAKAVAMVAPGIGQFGEELGAGADGFMGPSQWEPGAVYTPDYGPSAHELAARHRLFGPEGGDYAMAQAYAAGLVAQRCIEEAGTLDNHALREVAGRLDFTTFYGRFKLEPETGCQIGRSVVIVQWQRGRKVIVWPRELREGEFVLWDD